MFSLTRQERKTLLFIAVIILCGAVLKLFNTSSLEAVPRKTVVPVVIDVNSASQIELESLAGIGPAIAARIIEYREKYGKFDTIDDLKKVNGIGDKKLEKIRNYVEFD